MKKLYVFFSILWVISANTITTIPDSYAKAIAARQSTMIVATFSYGVATITSTATDEEGNPKSRTQYVIIPGSNGGPYSTRYSTVPDATTFVTTTLTSSFDIPLTVPDLYSIYPTSLSSGTNTFRVPSLTTVYTVQESTVMNGPLNSMTIYSTDTATISKGDGFTTRTIVFSRPIISTFSIPVETSTATNTFTITMKEAGPIVTGSSTPTTLLTRPSSSAEASSTSTSSPSGPAPNASSNKAVIIVAVTSVLVVAALGGAGFWFWRRRKAQQQKQQISQPTAVVRMVARPQDAFALHQQPAPLRPRSETFTSRTSGPFHSGRPYSTSIRPSYLSYTESDVVHLRAPSNLESENHDFEEYLEKTRQQDLEKKRESELYRKFKMEQALAEQNDNDMEEIERIQRQRSAENLQEREEAERAEQMERSQRFQKGKDELEREHQADMVPRALNIVKEGQQGLPYDHDPVESHYRSVMTGDDGQLYDIRPYNKSDYESIIPSDSESEGSIKKGKKPMRDDRSDQSQFHTEELVTASMPSANYSYDLHDPDDGSDEENRLRERERAEREFLANDTRESIYSQSESLGWNAYNDGMDLDKSPPHKRQ